MSEQRPTPEEKARARARLAASLDATTAGDATANAANAGSTPAPGEARAPVALPVETAPSEEFSSAMREAMGKLPFTAPRDDSGAGAGQGKVKTMPVPVMRSDLGETLPIDSDAIQKAMAVMPFVGGTAGAAALVAFPTLTVQQYVSLRAELLCRPDRAAETLRRYGVPSAASFGALEKHWQEQLAKRAELRAELDEAVATFTRWLRGPSR